MEEELLDLLYYLERVEHTMCKYPSSKAEARSYQQMVKRHILNLDKESFPNVSRFE